MTVENENEIDQKYTMYYETVSACVYVQNGRWQRRTTTKIINGGDGSERCARVYDAIIIRIFRHVTNCSLCNVCNV